MNHSISRNELRRWHAWIRVHQHPLEVEFDRLFHRLARTRAESPANFHITVHMNNLALRMTRRKSNPSRHDPRNGGAL